MDAAALDSEGRCLILEFPAFVLIGTYCPANRDETRDDFRIGFLNAVDARVRNLVAAGKRVILAGDLNIIRAEIDTANAQERMRKDGLTAEQFFSTPARRLLNHLVEGGKVYGERDEGRETPVLVDICREFHPGRTGMFTCWEQRKNARPGNFGSRIDYICVSPECKDWFSDSNIQEGLMGSDHCPVYAVIKDKVLLDGKEVDIKDITNPPGIFQGGLRMQDLTVKDLLPLSAKLIPEFDKRRSIRDMFMQKPSLPTQERISISAKDAGQMGPKVPLPGENNNVAENATNLATNAEGALSTESQIPKTSLKSEASKSQDLPTSNGKRAAESVSLSRAPKRGKTGAAKSGAAKNAPSKGQSSLKGFFKPKTPIPDAATTRGETISSNGANGSYLNSQDNTKSRSSAPSEDDVEESGQPSTYTLGETSKVSTPSKNSLAPFKLEDQEDVIDPIVAKESWSKLLGKRVVPRCEHNEPCITLLTKKPGVNCGRSFFICPRPLGPSGEKEKGTQWRCGTFIWSSDWNADAAAG